MTQTPDGRLLVCEQNGLIKVIKNDAVLPTPFASIPVQAFQERGLDGIALDPGFATNGYVYIYYTATTPTFHNRLSRLTARGDTAVPGSEVVLLDLPTLGESGWHSGGAMGFGPDGMLYLCVGENNIARNSQSLLTPFGKVLRLNRDGTIPQDNPFYTVTTGINRAIWALGLRNPFSAAFQPGTGRFFINDVGEALFEEVNEGLRGANYGWPVYQGYSTNPGVPKPRVCLRAPARSREQRDHRRHVLQPADEPVPRAIHRQIFLHGWLRREDVDARPRHARGRGIRIEPPPRRALRAHRAGWEPLLRGPRRAVGLPHPVFGNPRAADWHTARERARVRRSIRQLFHGRLRFKPARIPVGAQEPGLA
jgi:hypothetical protein